MLNGQEPLTKERPLNVNKSVLILLLFKSFPESSFGGYQLGHGRTARLQNSVRFLHIFWFCESSKTTQVQYMPYLPIALAFS